MWRSLFIAVGLASTVLGAELLAIDKAVLTLPADEATQQQPVLNGVHEVFNSKDFVPPEWAPWTLISVGAVIVLYAGSGGKE